MQEKERNRKTERRKEREKEKREREREAHAGAGSRIEWGVFVYEKKTLLYGGYKHTHTDVLHHHQIELEHSQECNQNNFLPLTVSY